MLVNLVESNLVAKCYSKEDTGKSLKNALHILRYAKRHPGVEATLNSEKMKPVALAVIELR